MFNDGDDDDGNSDERKRIFLCLYMNVYFNGKTEGVHINM